MKMAMETPVVAIAQPRYGTNGKGLDKIREDDKRDSEKDGRVEECRSQEEGVITPSFTNEETDKEADMIIPRHAAKRTLSEMENAVTHFPISRHCRRRPLYTRDDAIRFKAARRAMEEEMDNDGDEDEE